MSIYRIFKEITIGNYGDNFRVDITDSMTKHGKRLKITRKGGQTVKPGTSVPIIDTNKTLSYDEIRNHAGVEKLPESKNSLPLISGFVTIYHDELLSYSKALTVGDLQTQIKLRDKIEDYWDDFYDKFHNSSENKIRDYANNVANENRKRKGF